MSVEIYRSEEDESIVNDIYITEESDENIDMPEFANIKQIKTLKIEDITDFKKIQEMLNKIPLHLIEKLELSNCDFKDMDLEFFEKLENLNEIDIKFCSNIDYNEVIKRIPNKNLLRNIFLWNKKESENTLDVELLEQFQELEVIGLRNISRLDMEALQSVLSIARNLSQFVFEGHIQSLDFISGVDLEHISIIDDNLDWSLITPEVARSHANIFFETPKGKIYTNSKNNGLEYELEIYELEISSDYLSTRDWLKELIGNAARVEANEYIAINNEEELRNLIKNKHILKHIPRLSIKVPHMGIIEPNELQEIENEVSINKIIVMDPDYDGPAKAVEYTRQQYEILHNRIQEIVGDIPKTFTDLQKFMIIYQRLGSIISYDDELVREDNDRDEEYIERNKYAGRNLTNGLIKGKCVCTGYAEILYNCLQAVGIEACKICGEKHVWNKVKLDGVWYNVDLTWDCKNITNHKENGLKYCLRSDEEFKKGHEQKQGRNIQCDVDYPREEVRKAFAQAFDFRMGKLPLDAEYETIAEEPNFFDKLKARAMILFGKRKMIAAESTVITPKQEGRTKSEQRRRWQTTSGIVVPDSGQGVQGKGIDNEAVVTTKYTENPKEPKEPGDE